MLNKKQINDIKVEADSEETILSLMFEALGDHCRFKIFKVFMRHNDICVTDIANIFGITPSAASQQLRILERIGLVNKIKMGKMVCYGINHKNTIVKQFIKLIKAMDAQ